MEHEALSFFEAAKLIASKYNITVPERELTDEEKVKAKEREALQICLSFAGESFVSKLREKEPTEYLSTRHINQEILTQYGAGYAPASYSWLTNEAKRV